MVGPSKTAKSQLIYNWLKIGTFQPNIDKIYFFHQHSQLFFDIMSKEIERDWKSRVRWRCKLLTKRFVKKQRYNVLVNLWQFMWRDMNFQKRLLMLLLPEDTVDWVLFILSKTSFIKANLGETLSSRTRTLFSSVLPVMWCKSVHLVHTWDSDQS